MYPPDHPLLGVGLTHLDVEPELAAVLDQPSRQGSVSRRPIDLGFAATQSSQVRAVEHQDRFAHT